MARVAADHDLSERQVQRIYAEQRENRPARRHDPAGVVEELVDSYDAAIGDLAVLSTTTANDSVRLGAIRGRVDVLEKKFALMAAVGFLPHNVGQFRVVMEAEEFVAAVVRVLERAGVEAPVYEELALELDRLRGGGQMDRGPEIAAG